MTCARGFSPSPLMGEGWGEGEKLSALLSQPRLLEIRANQETKRNTESIFVTAQFIVTNLL